MTHTFMHAYIRMYMHTYVYTYIPHTYVNRCMHAYVYSCSIHTCTLYFHTQFDLFIHTEMHVNACSMHLHIHKHRICCFFLLFLREKIRKKKSCIHKCMYAFTHTLKIGIAYNVIYNTNFQPTRLIQY